MLIHACGRYRKHIVTQPGMGYIFEV